MVRRTDKEPTKAMREAAHHVKDFMTDNQKALTYLKIGKRMLERENYRVHWSFSRKVAP